MRPGWVGVVSNDAIRSIAAAALARAGVDPGSRGEQLDVGAFAAVAAALAPRVRP